MKKYFQLYYFSYIFSYQNPGFGLDPDPDSVEMLDPTLGELQICHRSGALLPKLS
jgi:hypothetical protein